ncbi:hypothetical protein CK203_012337 [Vitis vinifera]|uniref:Uncharacterized protein n=1 Tax=Vitis vinifera TaxID=29760 RepID=A0A438JLA6_VITVI|nr:hypothetical protein CK203_012337 [Vitis vinifera]
MNDLKVSKEAGSSWIEIDNKVHQFVASDKDHPESKEIYAKLDLLKSEMKQNMIYNRTPADMSPMLASVKEPWHPARSHGTLLELSGKVAHFSFPLCNCSMQKLVSWVPIQPHRRWLVIIIFKVFLSRQDAFPLLSPSLLLDKRDFLQLASSFRFKQGLLQHHFATDLFNDGKEVQTYPIRATVQDQPFSKSSHSHRSWFTFALGLRIPAPPVTNHSVSVTGLRSKVDDDASRGKLNH